MRKSIIAFTFAALLAAGCNGSVADTVIFGTVRTADEEIPVAEAVAVKDGKFVYVGDKDGAAPFIKNGVTQVIDHTGKGMIMPGCFEGHAHYIMGNSLGCMGGLSLDPLNDDVKSFFEKLKLAYADAKQNGKSCIFGFGWNYQFFESQGMPTCEQLDAICPDIAVFIHDSEGHKSLANSVCLRNAGIIDDDGNVLKGEVRGGDICKDANGKPNGLLLEQAVAYVRNRGLNFDEILTDEVASQAILMSQQMLLANGYVSYMDGWSNFFGTPRYYEVANNLDTAGDLHLLLGMTYEFDSSCEDVDTELAKAFEGRKYTKGHVNANYVKLFIDGTVEGGTGLTTEPYPDGHPGIANWEEDEVTDITGKATTDLDYPLYHTDMLNSYVGKSIVVTGANQFTGAAMPEYFASSSTAKTRSYLDTLRKAGNLSADNAAISPNNDGYMDSVFAALYLLRNAKVVVVTVTDAEGKVVKTMKPEYEYFETLSSDGNLTQQVSLLQGTKYNRNLAWDGTNAEGKVVADGLYNYNITAITEYDYLNNCGFGAADADVLNYVLNADADAQSISFAVKVDTAAPAVEAVVEGYTLTITASDNVGIQAMYINWEDAEGTHSVATASDEETYTVDLSKIHAEEFTTLTVSAVDFAMNETAVEAEVVELEITEQPVDYYGPVGSTATFTVETNSDSATYQWFYSNNGWSWSKSSMEGATTDTLSVEMKAFRVGQQYKVVVTDSKGNTVESKVVELAVASSAAKIIENPADVTVAVGKIASFSVKAEGEGLTYQWMYSNNGGSYWSVSTADGATTASMSITGKAFRNGQMYKCVVTDASGNVVESAPATMTVG